MVVRLSAHFLVHANDSSGMSNGSGKIKGVFFPMRDEMFWEINITASLGLNRIPQSNVLDCFHTFLVP